MPHLSVRMYPGRSKEVKQEFADKLQDFVVKELGCEPNVVSVSFKEIDADKWKDVIGDEIAGEDVYIESDF
ncbi:tautomerase family protein [Enterococcus hulanensis]|uniref:Tautomerase family protein n=1 Tax=Enterococcus hulanensis TaxID=2559929 RepID=A0ABU3F110_9ENTE|nr:MULTISPECIES: tautomerase family protein [Enterococcus]MBO0457058.1 tautomerase family protein [Enterococcus hulanensis]MBX8938613.1 4-oxalocrotonate tautomerase family enzyme [Enterococcus gilvus]MDT2600819.1 tautomerase family protein [Enterococcus hulanensis]MDT2611960.1 tautomerase family protein [Enterococcus hulanensis]MDT2618108.1 tautomerase family protein [Enterococcus hulanensis]